jgi:transposase
MSIRQTDRLSNPSRFFTEPSSSRQRRYEALRAFFVDKLPAAEVARRFGYSSGSVHVLCHQFRQGRLSAFFASPRKGPKSQPNKSRSREQIIALRKRNYSIYDISRALKQQGTPLSATAVGEVLKDEGFARLPRRGDDERPDHVRPTVEAVADCRSFALQPCQFTTRLGGLFLFIPDMIRLRIDALASMAKLPGSKMIPAEHALRAAVALKLWSIERKSHVMALVADPGLGLFCGLNAMPKKSFLSEHSSRITPSKVERLLAGWHDRITGNDIFPAQSFNLDFHSVPYFGDHPQVQSHYLSKRSRRQPSILAFLAQDADSNVFCYSNADLRKGEEADEIFRFIAFWQRQHGSPPQHLVFDSKLTTYKNLDRLDREHITFITLRRRFPALLKEIHNLPASAWRTVDLDLPQRKYRTPRVFEQKAQPHKRSFRQLFIKDLGHDLPTILLTNDADASHKQLITRYAKRMLIENALSDAVRFFHIDALSSAVGLKVDFDMALLVIASGLYRIMAHRMRGYHDAQARQIFRDIIDMPAHVTIDDDCVAVRFYRRAHLPIALASGLFNKDVPVPWWNGRPLRFVE